MPKVSKVQPSFDAGQVSKSVYGRVDSPRYENALAKTFNYIPIIQGPLIRRPGTKYVTNVKDSSKLPVLIPFQFSIGQNYILEFGDKYMRVYQDEGQSVTPLAFSNNIEIIQYSASGYYGQPDRLSLLPFTRQGYVAASSSAISLNPGEVIYNTSVTFGFGLPVQLFTPYNFSDLQNIKWAQKQDVMYITHPSYPTYKLERGVLNLPNLTDANLNSLAGELATWDLKAVFFQDGPYLDLNTYNTLADGANIFLNASAPGAPTISTGPSYSISGISSAGSSLANAILVTADGHTFNPGDQVCIIGASGTVPINNVSTSTGTFPWVFTNSSPSQAYWTVGTVGANTLTLLNSQFSGIYIGSGTVYPALFQLVVGSGNVSQWADVLTGSSATEPGVAVQVPYRSIALVNNGQRYWGTIVQVSDAAHCLVEMAADNDLPFVVVGSSATGSSTIWQMGAYNLINGFPSCVTFHQDRLTLAGAPGLGEEIDASMSGAYEIFSASGSNFQVSNNNALQFSLTSQDLNSIKWLQSNALGLLAGTQSAEWAINPATTDPALYPTNVKATQVTFYGSYDADAIQVSNAALYIQRAQRRLRELLYFWQVGSFRATNLSELSETITLPSLIKIVSQKEVHPMVWGLRSDGTMLAMTYKRDDVTLQAQAGWSYHNFGGKGNSGGSPPITNSMAVIPSSDTTFDELWVVNQRFINGTSVGTIEYMTKPFDDTTPQYLSYHFDCGVTFNSSIVVTGISVGGSSIVTAPNHGLANSSVVRFYNAVGMTVTSTDPNGNTITSSIINNQTFVVASVSTNAFFIQDFLGNYINTQSAVSYVGSATVNKLITSIGGLSWLENETVSILADGGIQPNTVVSNSGVITLSTPAAIVSIGYSYNSDGQMLRSKDGSAQGSSIGSTRRVSRVAFMLHNVGDLSFGPSFTNLVQAEFYRSDANTADVAPPLFDGIYRDNMSSSYGFDDMICFRQSSGLPGMIQAVTRFIEEQDV